MYEVLTMKMDDVIARINELAKLAKERPLTPEELEERDRVRRIYIDSMKASLVVCRQFSVLY